MRDRRTRILPVSAQRSIAYLAPGPCFPLLALTTTRVGPCSMFLQRPVMAVKIVLGFVLKMAVYWPWLARDLFFCQSLEQSTLKRYICRQQGDRAPTTLPLKTEFVLPCMR